MMRTRHLKSTTNYFIVILMVAFAAGQTAVAQTFPECKVEFSSAVFIPTGTPTLHFSFTLPSSVPVAGNRFFLNGAQEKYTYGGGDSFSISLAEAGVTQSGSIQLNPFLYPCDYFRFLKCDVPTGVIPAAYTEASGDVDVSGLTANGDAFPLLTYSEVLGTKKTHRINANGSVDDFDSCNPQVSIDFSFSIPSPLADIQLSAQNLTSGATTEVKTLSAPVTASIPLGARFTLSLQRGGPPPEPIMANFTLGTASLINAQQDPSLYPSAALLEFKTTSSETTKTFQAVHLGTQTVVMTPDDSALPRQSVTVSVVKPSTLGTTHQTITVGSDSFNLDAKIVEWADKRGIPPQLIKGIMDRETGFAPKDWRYEPLTTDWDNFSPLGRNRRSLAQYAPYRMEYDPQHARGVLLTDSEDVHPRSVFYSNFATKFHFTDGQQFVSAYDIVSENDQWQNWTAILKNQKKLALLKTVLLQQQTLAWPANTTLASSYGLMQVMFEESFENYGYAGINGQRRPYYLFDVPLNVAAGAGSIPVGSGLYVYKYRWENNFNVTGEYAPPYDNAAKLDDDYQNGLMGYNGDHCTTMTCYGPDTMERTKKYKPIASTSIFP
jgi:hypothetical protein